MVAKLPTNRPPNQAPSIANRGQQTTDVRDALLRSPQPSREVIAASYEGFEGPLPFPAHIEHYDKVLPGAAERIFAMAEAEQRSRLAIDQSESLVATDIARREIALQEKAINGRLRLEGLGMWLGFASTIIVIGAALTFTVLAPERIEKIGAFVIGFLYAAAQVVAAYRRKDPQGPPDSDPSEGAKRKKGRGR